MTEAFTYHPERAWRPLPCGGRALLPTAALERHYDHVPENRKPKLVKVGTRGTGPHSGKLVALPPITFGQGTRASQRSAALRGGNVQRDRAIARIDVALRDPAMHRYGCRKLVTGAVEYRGERPMLEVECEGAGERAGKCGARVFVGAGAWASRSYHMGKACLKCTRAYRFAVPAKGQG